MGRQGNLFRRKAASPNSTLFLLKRHPMLVPPRKQGLEKNHLLRNFLSHTFFIFCFLPGVNH